MKDKTLKFYESLGFEGLKRQSWGKPNKEFIELYENFITKRDKVLDLGCGYGRIAIPLDKKGYNVDGIDFSKKLINYAKKSAFESKTNCVFKVADIRKIPFNLESYDKVICVWATFQHMLTRKDQLRALEEVYRVLRNHGKAMFDVIDYGDASSRRYLETNNYDKKTRIFIDKSGSHEIKMFAFNRLVIRELFKKTRFKKLNFKKVYLGKEKIPRLVFILEK